MRPLPPPLLARRGTDRASSLPDEILLNILSSRLSPRDIAACCLISRRWLPSAHQVLYGQCELPLPNTKLARTLWNAGHLRVLVRKVRIIAYLDIDAVSTAGWLCLPGVRLRSLAVSWSNVKIELILTAAAAALASLRSLTLVYTRIPLPPAVEELDVYRITPRYVSSTVRALTIHSPSMPLCLDGFTALRKLVLHPSFDASVKSGIIQWSDIPSTVELLVLAVDMHGDDVAPPPPGLQIELGWPGFLTRATARALAGHVTAVRCGCDPGAADLLQFAP